MTEDLARAADALSMISDDTHIDPAPKPPRRIVVYFPIDASDRYLNMYEKVPPSVDNAATIRKMVYESWDEAVDVARAWERGDNAWIEAWQKYDQQRLEWFKAVYDDQDAEKVEKKWYERVPEDTRRRKPAPVFNPPPEVQGEPDRALLPIPEIRKSKRKPMYRVWLPEDKLGNHHNKIIAYIMGLTPRQRDEGVLQLTLRLALLLSSENPRIMEMTRGM